MMLVDFAVAAADSHSAYMLFSFMADCGAYEAHSGGIKPLN
jgi:hypothetical protein